MCYLFFHAVKRLDSNNVLLLPSYFVSSSWLADWLFSCTTAMMATAIEAKRHHQNAVCNLRASKCGNEPKRWIKERTNSGRCSHHRYAVLTKDRIATTRQWQKLYFPWAHKQTDRPTDMHACSSFCIYFPREIHFFLFILFSVVPAAAQLFH